MNNWVIETWVLRVVHPVVHALISDWLFFGTYTPVSDTETGFSLSLVIKSKKRNLLLLYLKLKRIYFFLLFLLNILIVTNISVEIKSVWECVNSNMKIFTQVKIL